MLEFEDQAVTDRRYQQNSSSAHLKNMIAVIAHLRVTSSNLDLWVFRGSFWSLGSGVKLPVSVGLFCFDLAAAWPLEPS